MLQCILPVSLLILCVIPCGISQAQAQECRRFRVHLQAALPPPATVDHSLSEDDLIAAIAKTREHRDFPGIFRKWATGKPSRTRLSFLRCLYGYVLQDSDGDGVGDWLAIRDRMPASTLLPLDPDMDGDGIENIFDPAPYTPGAGEESFSSIPSHLIVNNELARLWQQRLFAQFGVLAVDHTDHHSPVVLEAVYRLLAAITSSEDGARTPVMGVRFLYAFASHARGQIAASFHRQLQSISISGLQKYPADHVTAPMEAEITIAVAHEFGHALALNVLAIEKLAQVASKFGCYQELASVPKDVYDSYFIRRHIERPKPQHRLSPQCNIVSAYATQNLHEWFAESFAAYAMRKLLGGTGKRHQKVGSNALSLNINVLRPDFITWFDHQMLDATKRHTGAQSPVAR